MVKYTHMGLKCSLNSESLKQWQSDDMECVRYAYEIYEGDRILDIGSYQREWGKRFEEMGADVEYFDALDNRAAWTHDGEIEMGGAFYYTSAFEPGGQKFKCVDIAPYLSDDVQVCKINIEGMEYDLLDYIMDKELMSKIGHLQVQFHMIEGVDVEARYASIVKRLEETHRLEWRYPFCWESWQRK